MGLLARVLFKEPSGRKIGLFYVALSSICLLGLVSLGALLDGPYVLHFLGISWALYGSAESLPSDRRRLAGALRIGSIGVLAGFLFLTALAPEVVLY